MENLRKGDLTTMKTRTATSTEVIQLLRAIENQEVSVDECFTFEPVFDSDCNCLSVDIILTDFSYNFLKEKNEFWK